MYTVHPVAEPATEDFAACMRIGVQPPDRPRALPVLRIDRDGLTVAADEFALPPLGLPRRAAIVSEARSLCELRLVTRALKHWQGRTIELTMQPSRADDHAALWQALRAHQMQLGSAASGEAADWPHLVDRAEPAALDIGDARKLAWCDAAFTMANHDDAWFFAHWLEYHFAEVCARARMCCAAADLRQIQPRIVDHEVEVRFLFQAGERIVQACTEAACRWIAAEASREIGMTVEHWLFGASARSGSLGGWPRAATLASGVTRYPS